MAKLSAVCDELRGAAMLRVGTWRELPQTEQMSPKLDGVLKMIAGRGDEAGSQRSFNALGVIRLTPDTKAYALRSDALGLQGDFRWMTMPAGFAWPTPAGPGMSKSCDITLKDGVRHEVGPLIVKGKPPVVSFEMTLKRISDVP
jgi:hypothetical protein